MTRRAVWWLGSAVAVVLLLAGAGMFGFWWLFVGPPGPRNTAALAHLREAGYAPANATGIFISDTHGGLHGDGDTLLVFSCSPSCLDDLKQRVSRDYAPQIARAMTSDWSPASASGPEIQRSLERVASTDHGRAPRMPDLTRPGVLILCGERSTGPTGYCGNLFVLDHDAGRFWYLNIQT